MPIPILKYILGGKPLPLGIAHKITVQRWTLYIHHHVTANGLRTVTGIVECIVMPTEYMEPPCSLIQDAPEFNSYQIDGVWFTDESACKIQGKWQGMAGAVSVGDELAISELVGGFAQLAKL